MQNAFREAHTDTPVYYFELMSSGSYAKLLEQKKVFTLKLQDWFGILSWHPFIVNINKADVMLCEISLSTICRGSILSMV